jgi:serine/threonine protein kinase
MSNLIGQSLGRYHILEPLGEGGMATVYKARDINLDRDVAVKVIRTENFGSAILERILKRFEREARSLARLTHPNIVPILDFGETNGAPYLVMPYLPGGTLKERLKGPIPYREAVQMLIPIAQALIHAHQQGIIHRDIKPSNILITRTGEPMLSDFGIAKILDTEETRDLTSTGVGIGTPEYMAPEQGMGQADERADIYALGIVLYEMITGRIPFRADTPMAILLKKNQEPLPRPRQFAPNLPQAVENVLIKALARDPSQRYQSAQEFLNALEHLSHEETATVLEMQLPKKNNLMWIAAGIGGLIFLAMCGMGLFAVSRLVTPDAQPTAAPTTYVKPKNTDMPTIMPSSTIPARPPTMVVLPSATSYSSPDVIASRTTPSEVNSIQSIWIASGINNPGDISAPGAKYFETSVNSSSTFLWLFYWCTSSQATLNQNIKYTLVDMSINNVSLSGSQIYQIDDRTSNGKWYCRNWYTTLHDWKRGANIQLTIHYSFSRKINDGYTDYPAGDYYIQLTVTVK